MRYVMNFVCVIALAALGCSETTGTSGSGGMGGVGGTGGVGGEVIDAIEDMLIGRWWLEWDGVTSTTRDGVGLPTFAADGWANYDVKFPNVSPPIPDFCRRYADWSLFDVVSESEFGYALTYTHDTCNREAGWVEQFKVVLDQMDPPKGEVTRLAAPQPLIGRQWTLPIERCTNDINASEACGFETGLGPPAQSPGGGGAGGSGGSAGGGGGGTAGAGG